MRHCDTRQSYRSMACHTVVIDGRLRKKAMRKASAFADTRKRGQARRKKAAVSEARSTPSLELLQDEIDQSLSGAHAGLIKRRIDGHRQARHQFANPFGAPCDQPRTPACQHLANRLRRIAYEQHVAAGRPGSLRPRHGIAGDAGALHRQIVAENDALKSQVISQILIPIF